MNRYFVRTKLEKKLKLLDACPGRVRKYGGFATVEEAWEAVDYVGDVQWIIRRVFPLEKVGLYRNITRADVMLDVDRFEACMYRAEVPRKIQTKYIKKLLLNRYGFPSKDDLKNFTKGVRLR